MAPITLLLTLINAQTKRKIHTDILSAAIFENKDIDDNWSRTQGAHLRGEYIMFHIGYSTCPHLPLAHFQRFPLRFRREASRRFISPPTTLIGNGVCQLVRHWTMNQLSLLPRQSLPFFFPRRILLFENWIVSVHCCNVRCLLRISFDLATEMRILHQRPPSFQIEFIYLSFQLCQTWFTRFFKHPYLGYLETNDY